MIPIGSMITIDYTASITNEGEDLKVFDTTNKDVASREAIFKSDKTYEPMLVVLGKEWVPKGLEKFLGEANVGDKIDVVVMSKDAYGPKDPSKIKLVARREFQKLNINPSVGDRISINSQIGSVLSVSSTRVRMDYNHILAGKDIHYSIEIHDIIDGDENKIKALIKRRLPGTNMESIKAVIKDDIIEVIMPEQTRYYEYVQFAKKEVSNDIKELLPNFNGIRFIDFFQFS